jgi:hypothetical protein
MSFGPIRADAILVFRAFPICQFFSAFVYPGFACFRSAAFPDLI